MLSTSHYGAEPKESGFTFWMGFDMSVYMAIPYHTFIEQIMYTNCARNSSTFYQSYTYKSQIGHPFQVTIFFNNQHFHIDPLVRLISSHNPNLAACFEGYRVAMNVVAVTLQQHYHIRYIT